MRGHYNWNGSFMNDFSYVCLPLEVTYFGLSLPSNDESLSLAG
jgi:hypothetical protein